MKRSAGKADPAIYPKLRENALRLRIPNLAPDAVHVVLMDWLTPNGAVSVLAAADGTASVYLSSGGGFLGGGQRSVKIHEAALRAVLQATGSASAFVACDDFGLPGPGDVFFFRTTQTLGIERAVAKEAELKTGVSALTKLGASMQRIVTEYRLIQPEQKA